MNIQQPGLKYHMFEGKMYTVWGQFILVNGIDVTLNVFLTHYNPKQLQNKAWFLCF